MLRTATGSATYRVSAIETRRTLDVAKLFTSTPKLLLVTAASAFDARHVRIVAAVPAGPNTIQFVGDAPPALGAARLPGSDAGWIALAFLLLGFALVAYLSGRGARGRTARSIGFAIAAGLLVGAFFAATQAFPPTY
jgi:hypothetical protein